MRKNRLKSRILPHFSWGGNTPLWEKEAKIVHDTIEDQKNDNKSQN